MRLRAGASARAARPPRHPFVDSLRRIAASRYLRLLAALVFLVAISTQWTAFQLSLVATRVPRRRRRADAFFGTFNFALGAVTFVVQLLLAGPALRRFGVAVTILHPAARARDRQHCSILLLPAFWPRPAHQRVRPGFSVLARQGHLRAPLSAACAGAARSRSRMPSTSSSAGSRTPSARCCSASRPAASSCCTGWTWPARHGRRQPGPDRGWMLRRVAAPQRIRANDPGEHPSAPPRHGARPRCAARSRRCAGCSRRSWRQPTRQRSAGRSRRSRRSASTASSVLLAQLAPHADADIRRRALALLSAARDRTIGRDATDLLRDPDLGVRTEALLYITREMGVDPLEQTGGARPTSRISRSRRAGRLLASPGRPGTSTRRGCWGEPSAAVGGGMTVFRTGCRRGACCRWCPGVFHGCSLFF